MAESPLALLSARLTEAVTEVFGSEVEPPSQLVIPARDPRHGDYSSPAALALARPLGQAPMALAELLARALDVEDVCEPPEVSAPGFVNLRLSADWLAARVAEAVGDERVGVSPAARARRAAFDYSGPNLAKEMHVGHLRSTILGDSLANVWSFMGHHVERVNHLGDWGTQFGILIAHLADVATQGPSDLELSELAALYREANERFGRDEAFRARARRRVVDLQSGEPTARAAWAALVDRSRAANQVVYDLLGVEPLVDRGESYYADLLPRVVADLEAAGLVVTDEGAKCVFVEGFTNQEGRPLPLIVRKADGGYNYATTDLAALRHRVEQGAEAVVYVADAGQSQHFRMVFAVARLAGWLPDDVAAVHVAFGLVLGEDGRRLRTRSGRSVGLAELLTTGVDRARAFVVDRAAERGQEPPSDLPEVARVIGIGAVKYADLSQNRQSDYVFSFDRMLTLKGNTAPYLQYAYARMRSILREAGGEDGPGPASPELTLDHPEELALAKRLVEVGDVLDRVVAEMAPNHLCTWLYELAQAFNRFYETCPVLRADEPQRSSRLALCEATSATLAVGLGLFRIGVLERI